MEGNVDCFVYRPVGPVGKLQLSRSKSVMATIPLSFKSGVEFINEVEY